MAEPSSQSNPAVLATELNSIAERAQTYTGASGAAIALSEGNLAEMVCRASSGPAAPDIGAALRLEGTFTGMAVQSGQALRCDDSDTDNRVDAAACRALGTRSIVVVPVRDADTELVAGVLAVFAGNKGAFNDLHVAVLRTMAREVATAVQKARKGMPLNAPASAPVSAIVTPPPARPTTATSVRPPSPPPAPKPPAPTKPAPEAGMAPTLMSPAPVLKPPAPPPAPKIEARPPVKEEPLAPQPVAVPIVQTRRTFTPPAPDWKPSPPPPHRSNHETAFERAVGEPPRPVQASFGTFDSLAQKKSGASGMTLWIGVAAAIVLLVGGYFAYSHFSNQPAAQAQPSAPVTPASSLAPPAAAATTTPSPAAVVTQPAVQPATKPAAASPPQPKAAPQTKTAQPAPSPTPQPPTKQPQVVERAAVTPTASRQDEAPKVNAAPAPQIAVPITTAAPVLVAPAAKVSQSTPAQVLSQVAPKYPEMARTMHAEGNVQMEAVVGKDGVVKSVKVISGHALLRDAAASAVKQWKYKPATLNGDPVETTLTVTLHFQAPR